MWAYYRRLIGLRKAEPVIAEGGVRFLPVAGDKVIAYERTLGDTRLVVLCNFSGVQTPAVDVALVAGGEVLVGNYDDVPDAGTLRPWEAVAYVWR